MRSAQSAAPSASDDVLEQDCELVATQPRDGVGPPQAAREPLRDLEEQGVANPVPQAVVDRLEVVEVDDQHADGSGASGAGQGMCDAVHEERAIRHPGQRVVERLVNDVLERARVVQRQARVLGEREHDLLIAHRIGAVRIARRGSQSADHLTALEHGRRHSRPQALGRPFARHVAHERVAVLVEDHQRTLGDRPGPEPRGVGAIPCGQELLADAERRCDRRPPAREIPHPDDAGVVAEQIAGGLDHLLEDLVKLVLRHDRALDRRQPLEQSLAVA